VEHGASVKAVDSKQSNALHYAAYNAHADGYTSTLTLHALRKEPDTRKFTYALHMTRVE